jgi:hypothetical protein
MENLLYTAPKVNSRAPRLKRRTQPPANENVPGAAAAPAPADAAPAPTPADATRSVRE